MEQAAAKQDQKTPPVAQHRRRNHPKPLMLHLPLALSTWLSLPIAWPSLSSSSQRWSSNLPPRLMAMLPPANDAARDPAATAKLHRAITDAAIGRSRAFIAGIRAYQRHPIARDVPEMPVIWQQGSTKLRDYGFTRAGVPVLVIPSLINRFDILDLDINHSLLRFLAAHGFRPLVVDWDMPGVAEQNFTLTDYMTQRLLPILDFVAAEKPAHILGYCMGGLLALGLAILRPEQTRSLTVMATPWSFSAGAVGQEFLTLAEKLEPHIKNWGHLPVDVIQTLFASFQPTQVMQKFTRFAGLDAASDEARRFVLTEDWLNDGVPLTANVARECLREWYGENRTGKMQWRVADQIIDPRTLNVPAYVMVPGKDKIVTPESALPLARLIRGAVLHEPMLGHVGLLASAKAPHDVWKPLSQWLERH